MDLIFGYFFPESFYKADGTLLDEPEESLEELFRQYDEFENRRDNVMHGHRPEVAKCMRTRWIGNKQPVFIEDPVRNYGHRTWRNAEWSDITLAIAVDLNSPGEFTTRKAAGNKYVSYALKPSSLLSIDYYTKQLQNSAAEMVANRIKRNPHYREGGIRLNIAGNGYETLAAHGITRKKAVSFLMVFLLYLCKLIKIKEVRTGGAKNWKAETALSQGSKKSMLLTSKSMRGLWEMSFLTFPQKTGRMAVLMNWPGQLI